MSEGQFISTSNSEVNRLADGAILRVADRGVLEVLSGSKVAPEVGEEVYDNSRGKYAVVVRPSVKLPVVDLNDDQILVLHEDYVVRRANLSDLSAE